MASTLALITSFSARDLIRSIALIPESPPTVSGLDLQVRGTLRESISPFFSNPHDPWAHCSSAIAAIAGHHTVCRDLRILAMRLVKASAFFFWLPDCG